MVNSLICSRILYSIFRLGTLIVKLVADSINETMRQSAILLQSLVDKDGTAIKNGIMLDQWQ